jgi:GNAT superfamily N-acetyltransferase
MDRRPTSSSDLAPVPTPIESVDAARELVFADLSDFFNPFLTHFVNEALGGDGEVWVSNRGSVVHGLLIYNPVERVGSIFARDPGVTQSLSALKGSASLFSEFPIGARPETYHIYRTDTPSSAELHPFTHPVRMARGPDEPAIVRMMREMYGRIDTSWLRAFPRGEEKCCVVEIGDEIVGAGWVSVVNGHGRLHSLSVRPRYRRMSVGTDLWHARVMWADRAGAREVISEISEHNVASRAIAVAGGMHRVGQMFLSLAPGGALSAASG